MQENNFEKQVKETLEELQVQPSPETWDEVARHIGHKGSRRQALYYLAAALLLIGAGLSFWRYQEAPVHQPVAIESKKITKDTNPVAAAQQPGTGASRVTTQAEASAAAQPGKDLVHGNSDPGDKNPASSDIVAAHPTLPHHTETAPTAAILQSQQLAKNFAAGKPIDQPKHVTSTNPSGNRRSNLLTEQQEKDGEQSVANSESAVVSSVEDDQLFDTVSTQTKLALLQLPNMTARHKTEFGLQVQEPVLPFAITTSKKNRTHAEANWTFGAHLSVGMSAIRNSYLGIAASATAEDKAFAPAYNSNLGSPQQNTGVVAPAAPVRNGLAAIVGAYAQKRLGNRVSLSAGVSYNYSSTTMYIGQRVDSFSNTYNTSFYYRRSDSVRYTNRFHHLEIPVGVLVRLGSLQKPHPFYVYGGVTIARLLNSSSLEYDQFAARYYVDDRPLARLQLGINLKFLYALNKDGNLPLMIGPDLSYGLTKMASSGIYSNRSRSYIGVHLQKALWRR